MSNLTSEPKLYGFDIEENIGLRTLRPKDLEGVFTIVSSDGFMLGQVWNGFICEDRPQDNFKTFHFFQDGSQTFRIPMGHDSNLDVGATSLDPRVSPRKLVFIQPLVLGNDAIGLIMGVFASIGGANAIFTIIQAFDSDGTSVLSKFALTDNNLLTSTALIAEDVYSLTISVATDGNDAFIKTVTLTVQATALISEINLSSLIVESSAPIGTTVGALTTVGGEDPITYTIVGQKLGASASASDPDVDIFEISAATIQTKAAVGAVGTFYTVFVQAEDSRSELPDESRLLIQSFNIEVVLEAFSDDFSMDENGVDEYFVATDDITLRVEETASWSIWLKTDPTGSNMDYIAKSNGDTNNLAYILRITSANVLQAFFSDDGLSFESISSSGTITADTWTHVAVTFNNGTAKIYKDGSQVGTGALATVVKIFAGTSDLFIGSRVTSGPVRSNYYGGLVNECSLYNTVLTPTQVTELFNSGLPGDVLSASSAGGLISAYGMGEGFAGSTETDIVGSNDLTGVGINISNRSTDVPT